MIFNDLGKLSDEDSQLAEQLLEAMKKSSEKSYFLEFTKDESIYFEEEKLPETTKDGVTMVVSFTSTDSGKLYKNTKENYSILESDYLDKTFLIKDTLDNSGWVLSSETKKIGNYTAYKATKTIDVKEDITDKKNQSDNSTNLLSNIKNNTPKKLIYTAWYSPEIPITNGPENHGGLPGLILELHTPNKVYLCSEIVINPKKPIKIKGFKGKTISQAEFDALVEKHLNNLPKSKDGKSTISIQAIGY